MGLRPLKEYSGYTTDNDTAKDITNAVRSQEDDTDHGKLYKEYLNDGSSQYKMGYRAWLEKQQKVDKYEKRRIVETFIFETVKFHVIKEQNNLKLHIIVAEEPEGPVDSKKIRKRALEEYKKNSIECKKIIH